METTETTTTPTSILGAKSERYELELIPPPEGERLDAEGARHWLIEELPKYAQLLRPAFMPSLAVPPAANDSDAPLFGHHLLVNDIETMGKACAAALSSEKSVLIKRSNQWDGQRFLPLILFLHEQACQIWGRPLFDIGEAFGPIVWEGYSRDRAALRERLREKNLLPQEEGAA